MKLKDFFTLGNLLSGFAAVIALFRGSFDWACYLIYIGYVFDVLDGPVARLTGQFDEFGSIFDEVCDFVTNSIAVPFIIYYALVEHAGYHWLLAAVIAAFPFALGTIRQAKSREQQLSYPCYWLGVPRPVAAMFALALLNSSFVSVSQGIWTEIAYAGTATLIVVMSLLHLSKIPFVAHHQRRWMGILRFGAWYFLFGTPVALVIGWLAFDWPGLVFDHLTFCFLGYVGVSWITITKTDRRRMKEYVAGGPLIRPLVHRDTTWRTVSFADYLAVPDNEETDRFGREPAA